MIRGYFSPRDGKRRPFISARFTFVDVSSSSGGLRTHLLIDTGADRTLLAPNDAKSLVRLGINLDDLTRGPASRGIGGRVQTRIVEAVSTLESVAIPLTLTVMEPYQDRALNSVFPSLLGRDVLGQFALFIEDRTDRVLLLNATEANALAL